MQYRNALERVQRAVITGKTAPAQPLLRPHERMSAREQLDIYVQGYRHRLISAVRADYPALGRYLGDATMERLARGYAAQTPSQSYNLDFYPFAFRRFVRETHADPAAHALAALEGVMAEVFMGPRSEALSVGALAGVTGETLERMHLALRPASELLCLAHDAPAYLDAFKRGDPATIAAAPTYLYLYRHQNEVRRARLAPWEYGFLSVLGGEGAPLGAAAEHAGGAQLLQCLPRWIAEGFFRAAPPDRGL